MIQETLLILNQPHTHTQQSKFCEKIHCKNYDLTPQQLQRFHILKQQSNVLFEGKNQKYDRIIYLYKVYFQRECPKDITSRDWLKLGFQGDRPQRDLRGGGLLALQLIINFVQQEKQLVKKMQEDTSDFFFAISAINIAFFMKKFFHLADFLQVQLDRNQFCSRKCLKNFCNILVQDPHIYKNIHQMLLKYFFKNIWLIMKKQNRNTTLLNFNEAFQKLKDRLNRILDDHEYSNWKQLQAEFMIS